MEVSNMENSTEIHKFEKKFISEQVYLSVEF